MGRVAFCRGGLLSCAGGSPNTSPGEPPRAEKERTNERTHKHNKTKTSKTNKLNKTKTHKPTHESRHQEINKQSNKHNIHIISFSAQTKPNQTKHKQIVKYTLIMVKWSLALSMIRRLAGLMSRWMIFWLCRYDKPHSTCKPNAWRTSSLHLMSTACGNSWPDGD